jgi:hypothetical protein
MKGGSKWQLTDKGGKLTAYQSSATLPIRTRRSGPAQAPLAWPVARYSDSGWRLRVAWAFNGVLLVGGLLWLALMLRALDIDEPGGGNLGAFWRTFVLALGQAFVVQDPIKVLLISFVSPAFWVRFLKPGTKRAEYLRMCLRAVLNSITPLM